MLYVLMGIFVLIFVIGMIVYHNRNDYDDGMISLGIGVQEL